MTFQDGFEAGLWDADHCAVDTEAVEYGDYVDAYRLGYFLGINW